MVIWFYGFPSTMIPKKAVRQLTAMLAAFCEECETEEDFYFKHSEPLPYSTGITVVCQGAETFRGYEGFVAQEVAAIFESVCRAHNIKLPPFNPVWLH